MNRFTGIVAGGLLFASACSSDGGEATLSLESQQQQMTSAVEALAYVGGESIVIDNRVPCDFSLLVGNLVVQKELGPNIAVVADRDTDEVPEFGMIDCIDKDGIRLIRAVNGW